MSLRPDRPSAPSPTPPKTWPDEAYDGMLIGAGGEAHPPGTPLERVAAAMPKGTRADAAKLVLYINGNATPKDLHTADLQRIADATGSRVVGIHLSTRGRENDLQTASQSMQGLGDNPAANTLADLAYPRVRDGVPTFVVAHSAGAIAVSRGIDAVAKRLAEDGLSPDEVKARLSVLEIQTMGGASKTFPDGPRYVHHVNLADPIAKRLGIGDGTAADVHAGEGARVEPFKQGPLKVSHSVDTYAERLARPRPKAGEDAFEPGR